MPLKCQMNNAPEISYSEEKCEQITIPIFEDQKLYSTTWLCFAVMTSLKPEYCMTPLVCCNNNSDIQGCSLLVFNESSLSISYASEVSQNHLANTILKIFNIIITKIEDNLDFQLGAVYLYLYKLY